MLKRGTEKRPLPSSRGVLVGPDADEICGHLKPVLEWLLAEGATVARLDKSLPNARLAVVLDSFFYKNQIYTRFDIPDFVVWSYADAHYGEGNSLWCGVCRNSVEGRFDQSDPENTIGQGR